jgi:glutamate formiminotransferase/formiminotetrahydrofolate cyclodeaminase
MGALGAALGAMVGWLTYGRRKYEHLDDVMRRNIPALTELQQQLLRAVDEDTEAFADYMNAIALPKETEAEKTARREAMQAGLRKATLVPLHTMELVDRAWEPLLEIARHGQYSSRSDVEVGAKALEAAAHGAHRNVAINLAGIKDEAFAREVREKADALRARAETQVRAVGEIVALRTGDV